MSGWGFNAWLSSGNGSGDLSKDYQKYCDEQERQRERKEYRQMVERESCDDWY